MGTSLESRSAGATLVLECTRFPGLPGTEIGQKIGSVVVSLLLDSARSLDSRVSTWSLLP